MLKSLTNVITGGRKSRKKRPKSHKKKKTRKRKKKGGVRPKIAQRILPSLRNRYITVNKAIYDRMIKELQECIAINREFMKLYSVPEVGDITNLPPGVEKKIAGYLGGRKRKSRRKKSRKRRK